MAHTHSVLDTDIHFKIDGKTRKVVNVSEVKKSVFQYDHNSERFTFEIPRLIDGHDMTKCDIIQIHYINIDSRKRYSFADVYEVADAKVSADNPDVLTCSWLISNRATQYVGSLNFVIRFICYDTDGSPTYVWSTAVHTDVSVESSINNGESIVIDYSDILVQWEERLFGIGDTVEQQMRDAADEKLAEFDETAAEYLARVDTAKIDASIAMKGDNLFFDEEAKLLYLTSGGNIISDGIAVSTGGGSGGGSTTNAVLSIKNTSGWTYKTVSEGSECPVSFTWNSIEEEMETGPGTLRISVNKTVKYQTSITQGAHTIDISKYLIAGSNTVTLTIADIYGSERSIIVTVNTVALSLSSQFDGTAVQTGAFQYFYTPVGAVTKTVHFIMDNEEIGTASVSTSGRQQTFNVPAQSHGAHIFEVYFTADIDGSTVPSNRLKYSIICAEAGNNTPIITFELWDTNVEQFGSVVIPWRVYVANSMIADVVLSAPDLSEDKPLTVDRTVQTWTYRPDTVGSQELKITCGKVSETLTLTVAETKIDVEAETDNMSLYLTSYGRSNNEAEPNVWSYGNVAATMTNFNFTSDGWMKDDGGITVLRVSGDARVEIPVQMFAQDFRTNGKTIEIEFASRSVLDYDAILAICWAGGRGFEITAQQAMLKSEKSEVTTRYKEDDHLRLSFVIEKRIGNRLIIAYVNGIISGMVQYPDSDDFSQASPVNISLGSNDCTLDVYNIRVYDTDLNRFQMLDNWIADTQDLGEKKDRYDRNNIFDDYGQILPSTLRPHQCYLVINCPVLPTYKGDKKTCSGYYVDPVHPERSFSFTNAVIDVQGTSSQYYYVKNFKIKFENGFTMTVSQAVVDTYAMNSNAVPTAEFTFKADVASSEGANNVVLAELYNELCPVKTPAQEADPKVRQTIEGHPIVIFHDAGDGAKFIGKYNFNNDKGTAEVFGFAEGDESWEIKENGNAQVSFKTDDFTNWETSFEARYPDKNTDISRLQQFVSWVASTNTEAVNTNEEKQARLDKFKNELSQWADVEDAIFYYLFTLIFLCIDQREKNAFPTYNAEMRKWLWLFYDADSSIGTDNKGNLTFEYWMEDIDYTEAGDPVFNGQNNVFWSNLRECFSDEIKAEYRRLRTEIGSDGKALLSYDRVNDLFTAHQSQWSEAIYNEDAWRKAVEPLEKSNDPQYLPMQQGKKEQHFKHWMYNRFRYLDSWAETGAALDDENRIMMRAHAQGNIFLTSYINMYGQVYFNSQKDEHRMMRDQEYEFVWSAQGAEDAVIGVNSAPMITNLGDLSPLMLEYCHIQYATHLTELKVGDSAADYVNDNFVELTLGNNKLLRKLDVRNCTALTQAVDASGCTNIEEIYFDGTHIVGLSLPNGGILKTLHLPETITDLTLRNQTKLTEFVLPGYSNITTLRLENVSDVVPMADILAAVPANSRVRLIGFDWSFDSAADILSFYDRLDTMRGLDENGNNMDKAQMSGMIRVDSLTGAQLANMQSRYPDIKVVYQHITSYLYFYNDDGSSVLQIVECQDGADGAYTGSTPTKASTVQYTYSFTGWSLTPGGSVDADAMKAVTADRSVYAAFTATVRKYTVTWKNGSTTLETDTNVPYGTVPTYNGSTPVYSGTDAEDYEFSGWSPAVGAITGNTTYTAQFKYNGYVYTTLIDRSISGEYVNEDLTAIGDYAFCECPALTKVDAPAVTSIGGRAFQNCATLTEVNLPKAASIGTNAFYGCSALTEVDFPAVASVGDGVFYGNRALAKADFSVATSIGTTAFYDCRSLTALILRSETMCTLGDTNAFNNCYHILGTSNSTYNPSGLKDGYIYVPRALVDTYKADSNWSTFASQIRAIEDYPEICTRKDSFEGVIRSIDAGTYATDYAIGDEVNLDLGTEGKLKMQVAAIDTDELADGTGKAPITFIAKELLTTSKRMNPALVEDKETVTRPYWALNDSGEWISKNQGKSSSSATATWVITAVTAGVVTVSYKVGSEQNYDKLTVKVNGTTVADAISGSVDWTDYTVDCNAGDTVTVEAAYSKDGSTDNNGDTAYVKFASTGDITVADTIGEFSETVGTGVYHEGTGVIGGWEKCEMRAYLKNTIKPMIPATVLNRIAVVKKTHDAYDTSGTEFVQTTEDDVWIPSDTEVIKSGSNGVYVTLFPDNTSRTKCKSGSTSGSNWWLRNGYSKGTYSCIGSSGSDISYNYTADKEHGIALGFCIK